MKILLSSLLILFSSYSFCQVISGEIKDSETDLPIENVSILNLGTDHGTTSNRKGKFKIDISGSMKSKDSLKFSILGYQTRTLLLGSLMENNETIYLRPKLEKLETVSVNSTNTLKKEIKFNFLSPMPILAHSQGSVLYKGKIYISGGDSSLLENEAQRALERSQSLAEFIKNLKANLTFEHYSDKLMAYDIASDLWSIEKENLIERAYHTSEIIGDRLFIVSGKRLSTNRMKEYLEEQIEIFDIATGEYLKDDINPHPSANAASIALQNGMMLLGGSNKVRHNESKIFTDEVHYYDNSNGMWYQLPSMMEPMETQGVLVGESIYLVGGNNGHVSKSIYRYNLENETWSLIGKLAKGLDKPSLAHFEKTIYAFEDNRLVSIDTESNEVRSYRIDLPMTASTMEYYDNKLILMGGYYEDRFYIKPVSTVVSINLDEFNRTAPIDKHYLKQENSEF